MNKHSNEIKIGRFTISLLEFDDRPDKLWIGAEGGEGGFFRIEDFEEAVGAFYNEYF